jgi:DNA replication ATP-dependent helicase Dna2
MYGRFLTICKSLVFPGKTSTIAFIVRLLVAHGKRVLITSYTHGAVDTVMLKLIEKGLSNTSRNNPFSTMIRIGLKSSCHPGVQPCIASMVASSLEEKSGVTSSSHALEPSAEALRQVVSNARIVGVTVLSAPRSPLLVGEHFDVVIVDEAGQITQPAIIGPLLIAESFVLVGDHMQLPPLVISEAASSGGKNHLKNYFIPV